MRISLRWDEKGRGIFERYQHDSYRSQKSYDVSKFFYPSSKLFSFLSDIKNKKAGKVRLCHTLNMQQISHGGD